MHAPPPPVFRFDSLTARAAQQRSVQARRERKMAAVRAAAHAMMEAKAKQDAALKGDDYVARRLARVRAQLDTLDDLIAAEMASGKPDAQRLDRYASAQSRLAVQEQQLAGRPLPGSRRPREGPRCPRLWARTWGTGYL
jgi:hypothetical protein